MPLSSGVNKNPSPKTGEGFLRFSLAENRLAQQFPSRYSTTTSVSSSRVKLTVAAVNALTVALPALPKPILPTGIHGRLVQVD
ncbi:MAG TPA: hypothetical protein VIC26_07550 [Marinagarivorans sp.]